MNTQRMLTIKRYGYLLVLTEPLVLFSSIWLAVTFNEYQWTAWLMMAVFYIELPILDWLVGEDRYNPNEGDESDRLSEDKYYRWLTLLCLPIQYLTLAFAIYYAVTLPWTTIGYIGWALSVGLVGAVFGINVAHELIHKDTKLEQWAGGLLLASVCYGGFKVEHVRGHHVNVSTPKDPSSAPKGMSLYRFLPQAYFHNITAAWKLEAKRLSRTNKSVFSFNNELIIWTSVSFACAALSYGFFGLAGLGFFLLQSFIAFTFLEIVNYIEHYGLERLQDENGKYQRVTPNHSWNSSFLLTNLFLFQLQRHSDHHAFPKRRYQVLRHFDESPQLPAGYATMVLLALIPPAWKWVMDKRVDEYYHPVRI